MIRSCANCAHWDKQASSAIEAQIMGICRRLPPVANHKSTNWPLTTPADYCGELKPMHYFDRPSEHLSPFDVPATEPR